MAGEDKISRGHMEKEAGPPFSYLTAPPHTGTSG
jgi:hypothetical protein